MNKRLLLATVNIVLFAAMVTVNALATLLPLNNNTTGELADRYPNLFVPAGLTFSIWGVIYLLLAAFCVYALMPPVRRNPNRGAFIEHIGLFFAASCILNMGWIFAWHYELVALSAAIMLLLLLSLIAVYLRLNIGNSSAAAGERYLVHIPYSIYLGWISVATIANITALLVFWNWDGFGFGDQFWTALVVAVAVALAVVMLIRRRDVFYALVIDWALLGILIKRLADGSQPDQYVIYAVIAGLALVSAGIILRLFKRNVY